MIRHCYWTASVTVRGSPLLLFARITAAILRDAWLPLPLIARITATILRDAVPRDVSSDSATGLPVVLCANYRVICLRGLPRLSCVTRSPAMYDPTLLLDCQCYCARIAAIPCPTRHPASLYPKLLLECHSKCCHYNVD